MKTEFHSPKHSYRITCQKWVRIFSWTLFLRYYFCISCTALPWLSGWRFTWKPSSAMEFSFSLYYFIKAVIIERIGLCRYTVSFYCSDICTVFSTVKKNPRWHREISQKGFFFVCLWVFFCVCVLVFWVFLSVLCLFVCLCLSFFFKVTWFTKRVVTVNHQKLQLKGICFLRRKCKKATAKSTILLSFSNVQCGSLPLECAALELVGRSRQLQSTIHLTYFRPCSFSICCTQIHSRYVWHRITFSYCLWPSDLQDTKWWKR